MWRFWEEFKKIEPTVLLGGIYANKPGYHNARENLPSTDYSVKLKADQYGPKEKAAAIDLTFPSAQAGNFSIIRKYSTRLLNSGKDLNDSRGNYLREFYGNADGISHVDGWDYQYVGPATSDSSHLWHIHLSFLRTNLNRRTAFDAVLSILRGETFAAYKARMAAAATPVPPPIVLPPVEGKVLIQEVGKAAVYLTDNVTYWHVPDQTHLRAVQAQLALKKMYNKVVEIPVGNLPKFGKPAA